MKKFLILFVFLSVVLSACGTTQTSQPTATITFLPPLATATNTATPEPSATPTLTLTPTLTPTPAYPTAGYGPSDFPTDIDPLTGLKAADPALLNRRPMLIKIQNLPRSGRPQWGLDSADITFEYYTEEGTTRFAAIFYGQDASIVGPIRSGRFIDGDIVNGYKAVFAFGSAYVAEMTRYTHSDYANRLVVPGPSSPLTRYDPNGMNFLVVNTADLSAYASKQGINDRQDLDGMSFNMTPAAGGQPVSQVYVRYSSAIFNRWDYDSASGTYLRFSDVADASGGTESEQYGQLTDRLNNQPVAYDNLVVLYVDHELYSPGIYDILLSGTGDAYAFRDGQAYQVKWQRAATDVVSLTNPDGSPFAFKPGTTFFEVIGLNSTLANAGLSWRFTHVMP